MPVTEADRKQFDSLIAKALDRGPIRDMDMVIEQAWDEKPLPGINEKRFLRDIRRVLTKHGIDFLRAFSVYDGRGGKKAVVFGYGPKGTMFNFSRIQNCIELGDYSPAKVKRSNDLNTDFKVGDAGA